MVPLGWGLGACEPTDPCANCSGDDQRMQHARHAGKAHQACAELLRTVGISLAGESWPVFVPRNMDMGSTHRGSPKQLVVHPGWNPPARQVVAACGQGRFYCCACSAGRGRQRIRQLLL